MKLTVTRHWFTDVSTSGMLDIEGVFQCYSLEPRKYQSQGKPYCIPCGTYELRMLPSYRFHQQTPHILNVPGFTDIEIHPGNFPKDTEGCTLVGISRYTDALSRSREAFDALLKKLAEATEPISITYQENQ